MKQIYYPIIALFLMFSLTSFAQSLAPVQMDTLLHHHFADSNLVLIDVCTDAVYKAGHLQNAIHRDLYLSTFSSDLDTMDKSKLYVLICIGGSRSAYAMNLMKGKGFTRVYDISGGFSNWQSSGFPYQTDTMHSAVRFYSVNDFKTKLSKCSNPIIIDLRPDSLFTKKHLLNAQNIDTNLFSLSTIMIDTTKSYFIYGDTLQSIDSSILYSKYLAKYRSISFLKSGFDSWDLAGFPLYEKVDSPTVVSPLFTEDFLVRNNQEEHIISIIPKHNIPLRYELVTVKGIIISKATITNETDLSTQYLIKGIYFLRIRTTTQFVHKLFVN